MFSISSEDLQTIFSGRKSCSFFGKTPVGPEVHIACRKRPDDAPKRILEVRTPRPAQVDVERSGLHRIFAF